ncbi:MAG: hypothetical protein ACUVUE_01625 [Candidatus Bathycorpusculaceae bacterium]
MIEEKDKLKAKIKYKDVEKTVSGSPEEVWLLMNKFFSELIPSFDVAKRLLLDVDLQTLAKDCEGLIAFSPEGPNLMVSKSKLTDNETLTLWLLANYLGYRLALLKEETVSKEELQVKLGKSAKITSTRLGELVKNGMASKTSDEKYTITTFGVTQSQKEILPRIKAKTRIQSSF